MKRKNEEEIHTSTNNKKQKFSKELYVVKTTEHGILGEEFAMSCRFFHLFLICDGRNETLEEKEERLILSNADKINPFNWLPNEKCPWDGKNERNILGNLAFKGDSEIIHKLNDLTFPNCNETTLVRTEYTPTRGESILVFSDYSEIIRGEILNASELFKLEISEEIWGLNTLYEEINTRILSSLPDNNASIKKVYLEVKETSTAMDWYNYFKEVALMDDDLIKEKWTIMLEKGFCFDYPKHEKNE